MSISHPFHTEQPNQPKSLSVGPRLKSLVALRALRALSVSADPLTPRHPCVSLVPLKPPAGDPLAP